jgi:GxxExxY protein
VDTADAILTNGLNTSKKIFSFKARDGGRGYCFLEKIYENAMMIEFRKASIPAESQSPIKVVYEGEVVGEHAADILVDNKVIIELKAAKNLKLDHHAQLLNYLKATNIEVGLLLNFGPKPEISRKVFDNFKK